MQLSHDDQGSGQVVLLLHAGVADRRMWSPQADALSRRRRVVCPDLRGFGETPMPAEEYSSVADVLELLDDLEVVRAAVVGASMGGRVALELAATHPDRVSALALLCTAYQGLESTPAVQAFGQREEALLEAGDVAGAVEHNVATWVGPDATDDARDLVRTMQRRAFDVQLAAEEGDGPDPDEIHLDVDLGRISCATLVVSGELDLDLFRNIAAHCAAAIPAAEALTLPWAAHLPSLERPDELTALLEHFLDRAVPVPPE